MSNHPYKGVIFDLDGVLTRTAHLHAKAWKKMFDEYLDRRNRQENEQHEPFDIGADYEQFVDGKPRYDGVRSFLESRNISISEGDPSDDPGEGSVYGLGNWKNEVFHDLLDEEGVETYEGAVGQLEHWRKSGLKTALITSSRNGLAILEAAGLSGRFDVVIDGVEAADVGLKGKPDPAIFLEAANRLGIAPKETVVIEDAIAGVEAGQAGGFGLVIGVDRNGGPALGEHGADVVVDDLRQVDLAGSKVGLQDRSSQH